MKICIVVHAYCKWVSLYLLRWMAEYMNPGTAMDTSSLLMPAMAASTVSSMDIGGNLHNFTYTLRVYFRINYIIFFNP